MIAIALFAAGGCTTLSSPGGILYNAGQERKLAAAIALLRNGKSSLAAEQLAAICAEPGVPGVTDEALIRLALLRLTATHNKDGISQAHQHLERLRREFPTSSWRPLAANLDEVLTSTEEERQQNRKLKDSNSTLSKENKELRESIEKLKNLELELGRANQH